MNEDDRDRLLRYLIGLCEDLSQGSYARADDLFELTKEGRYDPLVSELAEAFGMMMVMLEIREFRLEEVIADLKSSRDALAIANEAVSRENIHLKKNLRSRFAPSRIIGTSPQMRSVIEQVEKVADTPVNVLITGETGTGKELIAKMLHYNSSRRECPLVVLNCSALPESIFESEMFGIEKGVATGVEKRIGKIEQAAAGTLFLDEVGDMPLASQAKILRVIESRELERVGGRQTIPVDIRVIAATNKDLRNECTQGRFREDLMYRLNVVNLTLPPLRERCDDISLLANTFLKQHASRLGRDGMRFANEVMERFRAYPWPGNVRELENEIERAVVLAVAGTITLADLSQELRRPAPSHDAAAPSRAPDTAGATSSVRDMEIDLIRRTLLATRGNKTRAAQIMGLSREGLRKKMQRYGLD